MQIGELPCFRDREPPYRIGDLGVSIVYDGYRDSHFTDGFVARTESMPIEAIECIERGTSPLNQKIREVMLTINEHYGAWQIHCPELREHVHMNHSVVTVERQSSTGFHKDSGEYINYLDTLMWRDKSHSPIGNTLVATDRIALHLLPQACRLIDQPLSEFRETLLRQMIDNHQEYDDHEETYRILGVCPPRFVNLADEKKRDFTAYFRSKTDAVLAHDWEKYEALSFSNKRVAHSSDYKASGTINWLQIY